jgi:hypothetical protein
MKIYKRLRLSWHQWKETERSDGFLSSSRARPGARILDRIACQFPTGPVRIGQPMANLRIHRVDGAAGHPGDLVGAVHRVDHAA